jgi:hypothetical protein
MLTSDKQTQETGTGESILLELTDAEFISFYILTPINLIGCSVVLVL